jgi:hypothetical protein
MALADVLQGRTRCASIHRNHPAQPRFNLWLRVGARHAFPCQRPDRSRGCGRPGERWRAGRTAWSRESATRLHPNGSRASRFPLLEGESSLEGLFAFRPTKQDTHASRDAPTSPAKAADRPGRRVSSRRSLPCPRARAFALGLAVWRDSLRRTPPRRRRFVVRRRSRQQPTAARIWVAPDGIVTSCWRFGSVLRF